MNVRATLRAVGADNAVRPDDLVGLPLIRKWIGFDTTSRESNLELIEWTRAYLAQHGVAVDAHL